ncbi:MAG: hypothetical protein EOO54_11085 [Haliea sp.]|nr:MAG: hypothetical protein EOO54_11085 [Haliea sp.]
MNLLLLVWYCLQGYRHVIHGDAASRVLLAREIFDSGQLFPQDWFYVNGDIWALATHLAVVPLLFVLPAGFLTHAISSLIFAALLLYGAWLLTGILQVAWERRLLILAVVAGGVSPVSVDFLFGQLTYGVILGICFFLVFLAYRAVTEELAKTRLAYGMLMALICFAACAGNPSRAVIFYVAPLLAALGFHAFCATKDGLRPQLRAVASTAGLVLAAFVAGAVFYLWLTPSLLITPGVNEARVEPSQDFIANLSLLWGEYVEAVVGRVPAGEHVASTTGLAFTARLAIALVLLWLVPQACKKHLEKPLSGGAFLAVFAITLTLLSVFIQLVTTLAGSGRFLLPGLICLLILALAMPLDFWMAPARTCAVALVFIGFMGASWSALYSDVRSPENVKHRREQQALRQLLMDNGLKYGYAPMWEALPISVMSDEKLLVRSIIVLDGLPIPAPWVSSLRWYRAQAWSGSTFLMLTPDQSRTVDWKAMQRHGAAPARRLAFGRFDIWVFRDNLASHGLPGWPSPMQLIERRRSSAGNPVARP